MSAWADQVEHEEATHGNLPNNSDFPSLEQAAAAAKQPKKPKAKGVKLSLGEFQQKAQGPAPSFQDKSLQDKQILASLPTAPRGGPREEGGGPGLGGGFRDYGGDRDGPRGRFNRDDRPPREEREPSRADAVDDWGATRAFVPGAGGGARSGGFGGDRGGFGDRGGDRGGFGDRPPREPREPSAADQVDNWGSTRKFEPSGAPGPRGGFGGDDRGERRGPGRFDGPPPPSKADLEDSWGRGRDFKPSEGQADRAGPRAGGFGGPRDGPARDSAADKEDRWARRGPPEPSPSGANDGPAERPKLKLAPRTAGADGAAGGEERKSGANPFGAARPREEVLKEKGVDPIKEALKLEHGEVIRDETPAEKELKEEIVALQKEVDALKIVAEGDAGAKDRLEEMSAELDTKERELLKLQVEEDDKVRFARGNAAREAREREPREARERDPREPREQRDREPRERDARDREPREQRERREDRAPGAGAGDEPRRARW